MLGFQRSVMNAFVHAFGDWLLARFGQQLFEHPGSVLFPKTTYELDPSEPKCADGASVDYVLLALAKGESARSTMERSGAGLHPFEKMLHLVQKETRWSLAAERLLLARLEGHDQ